jgi:hypothetical protein
MGGGFNDESFGGCIVNFILFVFFLILYLAMTGK